MSLGQMIASLIECARHPNPRADELASHTDDSQEEMGR